MTSCDSFDTEQECNSHANCHWRRTDRSRECLDKETYELGQLIMGIVGGVIVLIILMYVGWRAYQQKKQRENRSSYETYMLANYVDNSSTTTSKSTALSVPQNEPQQQKNNTAFHMFGVDDHSLNHTEPALREQRMISL